MKKSDFTSIPVKRIVEHLDIYLGSHDQFSVRQYSEGLPSELQSVLDEIYLWDISDLTDHESVFDEEWRKTFFELRRGIIRRNITAINKAGEENPEVQERLQELTKELSELEKSALT